MSTQVSSGEEKLGKRTTPSSSQGEKGVQPVSPSPRQDVGASKATTKAGLNTKLPDWITSNLTNARSLKVFFRCWLISWSCLILFLPHTSLTTLGQAAFLGMITSFIIPAAMPVWLYVFASGMLLVGILIGWAYGCAAMAASLRARNTVLLQQQEQKILSSGDGNTNPEALFKTAIFRGEFLDAKSTTVFGVFFLVGVWFIGVMQIKFPKLKVGTIFLLVILDIMCSYGPLFPFAQYTLGEIVFYPMASAVAIALVAEFLIFPETLNTAWQLNLIKMLGLARKTIGVHQTAMHRMMEEEPQVVEAELDPAIRGLHSGIIALATGMGAQRGFLELEITYSRLSGKDLSQLYIEIRTMIIRIFGLNAFFHLLEKEALTDPSEQQGGPVSLHETHTVSRRRGKDRERLMALSLTRLLY
jgi:preprotein translocase subunit SecG